MDKKGQSAVEYLIILAVIIILALIIIGVLRGISNEKSSDKASAIYWKDSDIGIVKYYFSPMGDLVLIIRNNLDMGVNLQSVSVQGSVNGSKSNLVPGATVEISISKVCNEDSFKYDPVIIDYSDSLNNVNYSFVGTVPLVGKC